jgi:predicted membrane channel-forming protein YqfA (hemolysin III family)
MNTNNTSNKNKNDNNHKSGDHKKWYTPILNFATHALVGTLIFLIVALPAIGLEHLVHMAEGWGTSAFVVSVMVFLERAILVLDAGAVLLYILVSTYKEIKEML